MESTSTATTSPINYPSYVYAYQWVGLDILLGCAGVALVIVASALLADVLQKS